MFIDFESGYPSDAGLVLSGELENGRVAASYDLDYYSIQAKMFGGDVFRTGGLATEMVEDPETGEMKETFVWPLEMAEMVDKTFSYGEPLPEEEPAQVKAQQANFGAVPFEAVKKQISVNNALFTSLRLAKKL